MTVAVAVGVVEVVGVAEVSGEDLETGEGAAVVEQGLEAGEEQGLVEAHGFQQVMYRRRQKLGKPQLKQQQQQLGMGRKPQNMGSSKSSSSSSWTSSLGKVTFVRAAEVAEGVAEGVAEASTAAAMAEGV
jgi:transcription initiation factor TFIID subunit TAF12